MKIIQQGELAGEQIYRCTCGGCHTLYEFQRKEARFVDDQRDGAALVTTCPMNGCGRENWTAVRSRFGSQWDR